MNRRHTITLLLFLMLVASPLFAQSRTDSSSADASRKKQGREAFVDQDGDGIDDRAAGQGKGLQRGKDRFIDNDGDGICDSRASGLGYRRGNTGTGAFKGGNTAGKGNRQGQGGKP